MSFGKGAFSEKSILENLESSRELQECGKQWRIRPLSRDSGEFRDFRDTRDSSSEKTPFVMTPLFDTIKAPVIFTNV